AVGCPKPQKKFFDYCFEKIGDIKKDETIIVGDSLSSDMLGGNNAGILCCWYNPTHNEKPGDIRIDFEIDNLNKIWEVLKIR
ncbi:MAG: HAD hydrolase-like protein, partial [Bacillota bacterium]|nr:HAD hydrolase-like protein [Bacillota bacterium]